MFDLKEEKEVGYTVEKVLEIARNEIGYKEKGTNSQLDIKTANVGDGNYTKYARDLAVAGYYQASKQGYEWCDMFHDWVHYIAAGKNADIAQSVICQSGPYGAGCYWSAQYYKKAGRFYTSNPKPGDQIFFNDYAHTGLVENVENGIVTTIEGNYSNQVSRCTYPISSRSIDGYGRPKYDKNVSVVPVTPTAKKPIDEIAKEVIQGKWGNGADRKTRLIAAGYNYSEVQNAVSTLLSGQSKKTTEEIVKEVLAGKWGNGADRQHKLTTAGYNYVEIQNAINALLSNSNKKSVEQIAREVIQGKWGTGATRKQKLIAAGYNYAEVQKKVNELLR